ncbi:hypothetical protein [Acinetobacter baumannii]|nr:hypothetical protein [Acinetobacter baumannii]
MITDTLNEQGNNQAVLIQATPGVAYPEPESMQSLSQPWHHDETLSASLY